MYPIVEKRRGAICCTALSIGREQRSAFEKNASPKPCHTSTDEFGQSRKPQRDYHGGRFCGFVLHAVLGPNNYDY